MTVVEHALQTESKATTGHTFADVFECHLMRVHSIAVVETWFVLFIRDLLVRDFIITSRFCYVVDLVIRVDLYVCRTCLATIFQMLLVHARGHSVFVTISNRLRGYLS